MNFKKIHPYVILALYLFLYPRLSAEGEKPPIIVNATNTGASISVYRSGSASNGLGTKLEGTYPESTLKSVQINMDPALRPPSPPKPAPFGKLPDGTPVDVYTLTNAHGIKLRALNYGGIVLSLEIPDRNGQNADVALGYKTLAEYINDTPYFGAIIGRYGNRIAHGKFTLEGKTHNLAKNNAPGEIPCALHGGLRGFDKVVWESEGLIKAGAQGVCFRYLSKDGEEGYPGNLRISVTYWLTDDNEWKIEYEATTDQTTPVNLTQHSYFNLKGEDQGDILGHEVRIAASRITPVNAGLIPTGKLMPVAGSPFDFTTPTTVGARIDHDNEQLRFGGGYDHNWVLDKQPEVLALACTVYEPSSGRVMDVLTTEPGVQFYTGNFLSESLIGKTGKAYARRSGLCLETQHFPDSPNHPAFPSTLLNPGKVLKSQTVYRFSTR